jgi:hypothetical protein
MRTFTHRLALSAPLLLLAGLFLAPPAAAVEEGLADVRIGASYRDLVKRFGQPHAILFSAGGGMLFQNVSPAAPAGLPQFGAAGGAGEMPYWYEPVRVAYLADQHSEWLYDFRSTRGFTLGILLSGEGADAVVTDVIAAGFDKYLQGKSSGVRTERGITFNSTFAQILDTYGYPPIIEIYAPGGARAGAAPRAAAAPMRAGVAGRAGAAARAGGRRGDMMDRGGMRGERGGGRRMGGSLGGPISAEPSFQIVLTGGRRGEMMDRGARGDMMDRGARGARAGARGAGVGARRATAAPARTGRGGLPPLGAAPPGAQQADILTAQAVVNGQGFTFSRDCILTYEGIAFTLHDMKVNRIHVSE